MSQTSHPNICFIYVDDQAAWTVGAYGNAEAYTPNLDRLAAEGALMENAFCSTPVCSPARAAMLTSRYSTETCIPDFIPKPGHVAFTEQWSKVGLDPAMKTFPSILAENGYENTLIGKWHVGDWTLDPELRCHPVKNGYHHFFGMTGGGVNPINPEFEESGELKQFEGYCDEILTERAVSVIQSQAERKDRQPFLLSLNLRQPHHPWEPIRECDAAHYEGRELTIPNPEYPDLDTDDMQARMKGYLSAVSGVDRMVGQVLEALDEAGLSENTIVIFSSDHGFMMGRNGLWHKGNGIQATKTKDGNGFVPNLTEESLRVPAIIRWPQRIQAGQRHAELLSDVDWLPTVLELAGCELPDSLLVRGRSWAPLVLGQSLEDWRECVYSEYDMCVYQHGRLRAIRSERWKLILDFHTPWRSALYDLKVDPCESENLISMNLSDTEYRAEVKVALKDLNTKLLQQMQQNCDPLSFAHQSWERHLL